MRCFFCSRPPSSFSSSSSPQPPFNRISAMRCFDLKFLLWSDIGHDMIKESVDLSLKGSHAPSWKRPQWGEKSGQTGCNEQAKLAEHLRAVQLALRAILALQSNFQLLVFFRMDVYCPFAAPGPINRPLRLPEQGLGGAFWGFFCFFLWGLSRCCGCSPVGLASSQEPKEDKKIPSSELQPRSIHRSPLSQSQTPPPTRSSTSDSDSAPNCWPSMLAPR